VGIVHDYGLQELRLYTDYGRCCRPLFVVEDGRLLIKKEHVMNLLNGDTYVSGGLRVGWGGTEAQASSGQRRAVLDR
jgi:hypothetical protein